jgi:hypothetical protein
LEIEITHTHTQRRRVEINEKYLRDEREEKTRDKTKKEKSSARWSLILRF